VSHPLQCPWRPCRELECPLLPSSKRSGTQHFYFYFAVTTKEFPLLAEKSQLKQKIQIRSEPFNMKQSGFIKKSLITIRISIMQ
jgi:hypothetical protein